MKIFKYLHMYYISMEEKIKGESYVLDLEIWDRVLQTRGESKGQDPVVNAQGYVYVGQQFIGRPIRVFAMKETKNNADGAGN
jgi:hypothetical protein